MLLVLVLFLRTCFEDLVHFYVRLSVKNETIGPLLFAKAPSFPA
ncbi:hypothetical protein WZ342_2128 [Enterococcus faecalis]|nr:hypothetical protein WZ342_2128 [Enterococcus faecalis]